MSTITETIEQAQRFGVDLGSVLSKREMQFLSGSFASNTNYARKLRFGIKQKLDKALQDSNGSEEKRYKIVTPQSLNDRKLNLILPKTQRAPRRECGRR